ncbi:branched-chain amino acid ABC transporter permease [Pokkaliibacter plantistimulans]|uniref:Branched-chain amino acid ABC transporter permease n=1 Tax=Proteobacteria bacterium 228 TaxID=2083153 RepID=A0A2S5KPG6_9PROT|nr:AzlC family ABC transporter permease [Pokkaliibacter plantistimulans]PPC76573.1 branched-chain amino acid ABC transporter permease [Pokkaliibacter plantistimulans]
MTTHNKTLRAGHELPVNAYLAGITDTVPLILAAIPFGILYGALGYSQGVPVWAILAMSLLVFAGASQFIAVGLLASHTHPAVIALTVLVVNLRHMLYAASLMPEAARLSQRWRLPLAFWLTDETYATVSTHLRHYRDSGNLRWYWLGSGSAMYINWVACTALGAWLSRDVPDLTHWGLEVALVVAFVGMVVPAIKQFSHLCCAVTAGGVILLTYDWPHNTGLLVTSLVAIGVGIGTEMLSKKTAPLNGATHHE